MESKEPSKSNVQNVKERIQTQSQAIINKAKELKNKTVTFSSQIISKAQTNTQKAKDFLNNNFSIIITYTTATTSKASTYIIHSYVDSL